MGRPAVIFDLDDTVYPSDQFVEGGIRAAAPLLNAAGRPGLDAGGVLLEILRREGPFHVFDRGLQVLGIDRTPELMASLVSTFRGHRPSISPYPGIREMISGLRRRGVLIGLVTDGYPEVQRSKWESLGLAELFDAVVFCRDVDGLDCPKPDPLPFSTAAALLGDPFPVVFVGDNPAMDFPAPDSFGWNTVRVCWPGASHEKDGDVAAQRRIVRTVSQLSDVLERLTGVTHQFPAGR